LEISVEHIFMLTGRKVFNTTHITRHSIMSSINVPQASQHGSRALHSPASGVITSPELAHVGAQFYSKAMGAVKQSSTATKPTQPSLDVPDPLDSNDNLFELARYLETGDRLEVLGLGLQSSRKSRAFDRSLIAMMDSTLLKLYTASP
jgi:hypothetical protein